MLLRGLLFFKFFLPYPTIPYTYASLLSTLAFTLSSPSSTFLCSFLAYVFAYVLSGNVAIVILHSYPPCLHLVFSLIYPPLLLLGLCFHLCSIRQRGDRGVSALPHALHGLLRLWLFSSRPEPLAGGPSRRAQRRGLATAPQHLLLEHQLLGKVGRLVPITNAILYPTLHLTASHSLTHYYY